MPTATSTAVTLPPPLFRYVRTAKISAIHSRLPGTSTFQPSRMNWS